MKHKNRRKFFKQKDRDLSKDRVLHSFCYTRSGLVIESLIFDSGQDDLLDDYFRFNGYGVKGYFPFCGTRFQGKYHIGDIIDFPIREWEPFPVRSGYCFRVRTSEKRRIADIELSCDSVRKHQSRIVYIIYRTEAI